jgi:hypothetical protein
MTRQLATFSFVLSRDGSVLNFAPTHARATLYVMIVSSGSLATPFLLRVHGCRSLYAMGYGLVEAGDAIKD